MDNGNRMVDDKDRPFVVKVRLNQAESEALAKLTTAKGLKASAVIRQFIRRAALGK
jgi:hypothetical protein